MIIKNSTNIFQIKHMNACPINIIQVLEVS